MKMLITGAGGFLGKHILYLLDPQNVFSIKNRKTYDLTNISECEKVFEICQPKHVIHCAGHNGGIEFNKLYPADVFYQNTQMALNIFECCKKYKVEKIVSIITSCAYPDLGNEIKEYDLWLGKPNKTIACHGYAKRNLDVLSQMYSEQYGLKAITVCLNTLYGPGDTLDLTKAKVLTSLILKIFKAKKENIPEVILWGDGSPKREFIYVKDAARLVLQCLEKYEDSSEPINISSGQEYRIKKLAETVCNIINYEGKIIWDKSKPNGQMRKFLNIDKMLNILGNQEFIPLEQGIKETVDWLKEF